MIPKIEGCIEVVEAGVEAVVIINGRVPHSVLLELLTDHGAGTLVGRRKPQVEEAQRMSARAASGSGRSGAAPALRFERSSGRSSRAASTHTRIWIFDLDNTLYPAECNLFAEVDQRMGDFIAKYLGVPFEHARHLQKSYYRQFGTTLSGLMQRAQDRPAAVPRLRARHRPAPLCEAPELGGRDGGATGAQADLHQRLAPACRAGRRKARRARSVRGHLRHRRLRVRAQARTRCLQAHGATATAWRRPRRPCSRTCR